MQGNHISARLFGFQRRPDRIRIGGAARIAQGGDVIDIDAQFNDRADWMQEAHEITWTRRELLSEKMNWTPPMLYAPPAPDCRRQPKPEQPDRAARAS